MSTTTTTESRDMTAETTRENSAALIRWLALVACAGVAIAVLMGFVARSIRVDSPVGEGTSLVGGDAADFRLPVLGGGESGPADFSGKVVIIDFWASWCGPCRLQAAFLEEMHEEYDASQVQFLAINVGEDEKTVQAYVDATPFPYPVLMDQQNVLSNRYEIYGLPTVMVVDKNGTIAYRHSGVLDKETLAKKVAQAGVPVPTDKEA